MRKIRNYDFAATRFIVVVLMLAFLGACDDGNSVKHPFQAKLQFTIDDGFSEVCRDITTVPTGKQLVIEYASGVVRVPAGQNLRQLTIRTKLNGDFVYHHLPATPTNVYNEFIAGQQVRLYADPNTAVNFCAARNAASDSGKVFVSISGYLMEKH